MLVEGLDSGKFLEEIPRRESGLEEPGQPRPALAAAPEPEAEPERSAPISARLELPPPAPEPRPARRPPTNTVGLEDRIFAFIVEHQPCSTSDITKGLGEQRGGPVADRLRRMRGELPPRIAWTGTGVNRWSPFIYSTVDRMDRDVAARESESRIGRPRPGQVLELVRENNGDLNDERLALALDANREDVSSVCAKLVEQDSLRVIAQGCYTLGRTA